MCDLICDPDEQCTLEDLAIITRNPGFQVKITNKGQSAVRCDESAQRKPQLRMLSDRFQSTVIESESQEQEEGPKLDKSGLLFVGLVVEKDHPVRMLVRDNLDGFFPKLTSIATELQSAKVLPLKNEKLARGEQTVKKVDSVKATESITVAAQKLVCSKSSTELNLELFTVPLPPGKDFLTNPNLSTKAAPGVLSGNTNKIARGQRSNTYNPQSRNRACIEFSSHKSKLYESDDNSSLKDDEWIVNEGRENLDKAFDGRKQPRCNPSKNPHPVPAVSSPVDDTSAIWKKSKTRYFHGRLLLVSGGFSIPPPIVPSFNRFHSLYISGKDSVTFDDCHRRPVDPRKVPESMSHEPIDLILLGFSCEKISATSLIFKEFVTLPPNSPVYASSDNLVNDRCMDGFSLQSGAGNQASQGAEAESVNLRLKNITEQVNLDSLSAHYDKDIPNLNDIFAQCIGNVNPTCEYEGLEHAQILVQDLITFFSDQNKDGIDSSKQEVNASKQGVNASKQNYSISEELGRNHTAKTKELLDMVSNLICKESGEVVEGQDGVKIVNGTASGVLEDIAQDNRPRLGGSAVEKTVMSVGINNLENNEKVGNGHEKGNFKRRSRFSSKQEVGAYRKMMRRFSTLKGDNYLKSGCKDSGVSEGQTAKLSINDEPSKKSDVEDIKDQKYRRVKSGMDSRRSRGRTVASASDVDVEISGCRRAPSHSRRNKETLRSYGSPLKRESSLFRRAHTPRESPPGSPKSSAYSPTASNESEISVDEESRYRSTICQPSNIVVNAARSRGSWYRRRSSSLRGSSSLSDGKLHETREDNEKELLRFARGILEKFATKIDKALHVDVMDPAKVSQKICFVLFPLVKRFLRIIRCD